MIKEKNKVFNMVICGLFAAICCIFSVIAIPIGMVPVSLGNLAIFFAGVVLGPGKGIVSVSVYLALGLFLPIFSGGQNGISAYFGLTGGYVWSYFLVVLVVGVISRINIKNRVLEIIVSILGCGVGMLICLICGTIQFMAITGYDLYPSLTACVIPFIPFDIIKCVIAGVIGTVLKNTLKKAGYLK